VDGQPYSLQHGRVFLYFFDPHCSHCFDAAQKMGAMHWSPDVALIGVPTSDVNAVAWFYSDTKFKAATSPDADTLKKTFPFGDPPYAVALENGREKGPVAHFDGPEPAATLRKLGFIE
jgi:hypothetical protein